MIKDWDQTLLVPKLVFKNLLLEMIHLKMLDFFSWENWFFSSSLHKITVFNGQILISTHSHLVREAIDIMCALFESSVPL